MTSPVSARSIGGQPRWLVIMVGLAATVVVVAGMRSISGILAPAFLALVLTVTVHPLRHWLTRHRAPTWVASIAAIVTAYLIVLVLIVSLVLALAKLAVLVPSYAADAEKLKDDFASWLHGLGIGKSQVQDMLKSVDLGKVTDVVTTLLSSTLAGLSNLFFLVTLLLFLSVDGSWFPRRLGAARPGHGLVVEAFERFAHGTRSYLVVSTVFGLIVAVIDTLLLWALGIPAPILWGLLAFITNYIPNIGFVIGLVPPSILGLLEGGPQLMLVVIAMYCVINVVIQTFIQPKVVGDAVGLSTSLTFLSLVVWTWVLGPLGALLAIPLSLLVKALLVDVDPDAQWLVPLISGDEPRAPEQPPPGEEPGGVPEGEAVDREPADTEPVEPTP